MCAAKVSEEVDVLRREVFSKEEARKEIEYAMKVAEE